MRKVVIFIALFGMFIQVQAQNIKVLKVEQVKKTVNYSEEVENPPYAEAIKFIKTYKENDLSLISTIEQLKKMTFSTDLVNANFEQIIQLMKEHQLQTSTKGIDEVADLEKISKSDIKKQVRKYGNLQIIGWDNTISSVTPIKDKYKVYLESEELIKNAIDRVSTSPDDYRDPSGKRIVTKTKIIYTPSPEFTIDVIRKMLTDSVPLNEIKNTKEYYTNTTSGEYYNDSEEVIYNVSEQKYVTPELEKAKASYKAKAYYSEEISYLLFEYNGKKYAITPKTLQNAKDDDVIINNLPEKYGYYENDDIRSDIFKINIGYGKRKEIFVKKGTALPVMLNDIEKGAKQIIAIYDQMEKYNTKAKEYGREVSMYGRSAASKNKSSFLVIVEQIEKLNNGVKKIKQDLDNKYNLNLSEKFDVFVKKGRYEDPEKVEAYLSELKTMLSYL